MNPIRADGLQGGRAFFGTILVFTLIGMVAMMLLALFLQFKLAGPEYHLPNYLLFPLFAVAAAPGFVFGIWYAKKQQHKQHWQLTDTELTCGLSGAQAFPLGSIQKIIVGLPVGRVGKILRNDKPGSMTSHTLDALSATHENWKMLRQVYLPAKENSLLICFNDGSWLPLCLYSLPNGAAIMDALKERFKDRLVHDYNYSPEEIRRLRRRDINELIPK